MRHFLRPFWVVPEVTEKKRDWEGLFFVISCISLQNWQRFAVLFCCVFFMALLSCWNEPLHKLSFSLHKAASNINLWARATSLLSIYWLLRVFRIWHPFFWNAQANVPWTLSIINSNRIATKHEKYNLLRRDKSSFRLPTPFRKSGILTNYKSSLPIVCSLNSSIVV